MGHERVEIERLVVERKLVMAARLCKATGVDLRSIPGVPAVMDALYQAGRFQDLLATYREVGVVGPHSTAHLLKRLADKGNYSSYLKHAARFRDEETREEAMIALHARVDQLLRKGALVKAARACRKFGVRPESIRGVEEAVARLVSAGQYQVVLGAFYEVGVFGDYSVESLLKQLGQTEMKAAFLANAYRFGITKGLEAEIQAAITWHRNRGLKDADAWERKFAALETLPEAPLTPATPVPSGEAQPGPTAEAAKKAQSGALQVQAQRYAQVPSRTPRPAPSPRACKVLRLQPARRPIASPAAQEDDAVDDPYVVSWISRVKVEQATREHQRTLTALEDHLGAAGFQLFNSKLIDLLGERRDWKGIFEVKSINQDNERDQVRHAVGQLFEYRFLHDMPTAHLFVVFSREPFSGWLVDYLRGLGLGVLWLEDESFDGPDLAKVS